VAASESETGQAVTGRRLTTGLEPRPWPVGRFLHFFSEVVTMARGSLSLSSQELFLSFVGNSVIERLIQPREMQESEERR